MNLFDNQLDHYTEQFIPSFEDPGDAMCAFFTIRTADFPTKVKGIRFANGEVLPMVKNAQKHPIRGISFMVTDADIDDICEDDALVSIEFPDPTFKWDIFWEQLFYNYSPEMQEVMKHAIRHEYQSIVDIEAIGANFSTIPATVAFAVFSQLGFSNLARHIPLKYSFNDLARRYLSFQSRLIASVVSAIDDCEGLNRTGDGRTNRTNRRKRVKMGVTMRWEDQDDQEDPLDSLV